MLRAEGCFTDNKRPPQEWFRFFIATLSIVDEAQIVQGKRHVWVVQPEGFFANTKCLPASGLRFVVEALVG